MFLVPECYRIREGRFATTMSDGNNGVFCLPDVSAQKRTIWIIASDGEGWEHVSVHVNDGRCDRTPVWAEMCRVKDLFWDPEDVVMQLHPRRSQYVSYHDHTLHLWRPIGATIPEPPSILVGPRGG